MKKIIAFILACLTATSLFAGCDLTVSPTPTPQIYSQFTPAPTSTPIAFQTVTGELPPDAAEGSEAPVIWKYLVTTNKNGEREATIYGYEADETVVTIPSEVNGIPVTGIDVMGLCRKVKVFVSGSRYECIMTEVTIPASIKNIPSDLFACANDLAKVKFEEGSDFLLENNILYNKNKTVLYLCFDKNVESFDIPASVETIGGGAFRNCSNLKSIDIPATVKHLGEYAFYNCTSLANVTLSEGLYEIANYVFTRCPNIDEITIPKSVESIGLQILSFAMDVNPDYNKDDPNSEPYIYIPKIKVYKDSYAAKFITENSEPFGLGVDYAKCLVYID